MAKKGQTFLEKLGFSQKKYGNMVGSGEAIKDHLVERSTKGFVWVDKKLVTTNTEYKRALGLDARKKYPHPLGWTKDWATLEWLRQSPQRLVTLTLKVTLPAPLGHTDGESFTELADRLLKGGTDHYQEVLEESIPPMKKPRRFVLFFLKGVPAKRYGHVREKDLFTVTAFSAEAAYRKVTGWTGKITHSGGHMNQRPVRKVAAFLVPPKDTGIGSPEWNAWVNDPQRKTMPSLAYVVPLGQW